MAVMVLTDDSPSSVEVRSLHLPLQQQDYVTAKLESCTAMLPELLAAAHNCRQQLSGIDKFDNNQVRLGLSHRK